MRPAKSILAAILLTAPFSVAAAQDAPAMTRGEAELAELLEGHVVVGEPESCISSFPSARMTIIDETAIVVRQGGRLYVNIPNTPQTLDEDDILITRTYGARFCKNDIVNTASRAGGIINGSVFLNDFIQYRRVDD